MLRHLVPLALRPMYERWSVQLVPSLVSVLPSTEAICCVYLYPGKLSLEERVWFNAVVAVLVVVVGCVCNGDGFLRVVNEMVVIARQTIITNATASRMFLVFLFNAFHLICVSEVNTTLSWRQGSSFLSCIITKRQYHVFR